MDTASTGCFDGESFLVLETKPKQNIGTILRCAVAFGIGKIVIIGSPKFGTHGAHGAQKFMPVMHFFYWENFYRFAKAHGIRTVAICTQLLLLREKLQSCSASKYAFTPLQRYAFCSFPLGLPEHAVEMCDDKMHVSFPAGPNLSELINFDATISICLQYYRMSTGLDVGETGIIKEKFALGLQSTKGGVTFMDSETSESLLQSGADGEEFGLFCFAEENDEIC